MRAFADHVLPRWVCCRGQRCRSTAQHADAKDLVRNFVISLTVSTGRTTSQGFLNQVREKSGPGTSASPTVVPRGRAFVVAPLAGLPRESRFEGDLMFGVHADRLTGPDLVTLGRAWLRACVPSLTRLRKTATAVTAGAPIRPGERVLISVRQVSEALVVATGHAVYHQDSPERTWSRLGWEDVDQVMWDGEQHVLTLTRASHGRSPVVLRLPRGGPLADFARERLTATTLARAPVLSGGRVCGWLAARRPPGSDRVRWELTLRDPTASGDPSLQSRVAAAIAALEADLGLQSWRPAATHEGWWPQS